MARIVRPLLILLVILGIVLPRVSAAVTLVAPGVHAVIICTGDGLRTLVLDADGTPVPAAGHPDACVLVHSADTSDRVPSLAATAAPEALVWRIGQDLGALPAGRGMPFEPRAPPLT